MVHGSSEEASTRPRLRTAKQKSLSSIFVFPMEFVDSFLLRVLVQCAVVWSPSAMLHRSFSAMAFFLIRKIWCNFYTRFLWQLTRTANAFNFRTWLMFAHSSKSFSNSNITYIYFFRAQTITRQIKKTGEKSWSLYFHSIFFSILCKIFQFATPSSICSS